MAWGTNCSPSAVRVALRALRLQGLDPAGHAPVAVVGHSQGLLAAKAAQEHGSRDAELLAVAQLIGAAATLVARRRGLIPVGEKSPMVAVSNVDPEQLKAILTYHVIAGEVMAKDVKPGKVTTVNGEELTIGVNGDKVTITDAKGNTVNVTKTDITTDNGVIHVIDGVLMP